jgi:hypothetical protein
MRKMCQDVSNIFLSVSSVDLIALYSYGRFTKSINPDECGMSCEKHRLVLLTAGSLWGVQRGKTVPFVPCPEDIKNPKDK